MNLEIFQELSVTEVAQYSIELDHAIENHARWLSQINRTIICHLSADENDLADEPHLHCHFGRWYHGTDNPALESIDSFQKIGPIHASMHGIARDLLHKAAAGMVISESEYDALVQTSDSLRRHIFILRGDFNRNRDLISRLMGKAFENADEGVIIAAPDTTIVSVNNAFTEVTGYSAEEVIGQTPKLFQSGRQGENFYRHMWSQLDNHGQWQGEIWNRSKAGNEYLEWLSIAAVKDEQGQISHYIAIFSDITSEKENEERLHNLAHYDQLTGLPNRILFNERLRYALTQAERNQELVAVMFLDLDGFKPINDTFGHAAGDRLLLLVAQRLRYCLRASDTVARFGGDEFTIVLPCIDEEDSIVRIAEKIITEVALPYDLEGQQVSITTSIGISIFPNDSHSTHELVQYSDGAMYLAKRQGKNQYRFFTQDPS